MTYDRNTVAEALRLHIERNYYNQKEAAEKLHIPRSSLCHMLKGRLNPCGPLLADAGLVRKTVYEPRGQ